MIIRKIGSFFIVLKRNLLYNSFITKKEKKKNFTGQQFSERIHNNFSVSI